MKKYIFLASILFALPYTHAMLDQEEQDPMTICARIMLQQASDKDRDPVKDILEQPCYAASCMRHNLAFMLQNSSQIATLENPQNKEQIIQQLTNKYKKDSEIVKKDLEAGYSMNIGSNNKYPFLLSEKNN